MYYKSVESKELIHRHITLVIYTTLWLATRLVEASRKTCCVYKIEVCLPGAFIIKLAQCTVMDE
jgi:hypothetical protein